MNIKYFYDCEFLEGPQKKRVFEVPFGKTPNTIDLISIGVVSENEKCKYDTDGDGNCGRHQPSCPPGEPRELYLVSKEFNLKEAWNRFDWKRKTISDGIAGAYKEHWIRWNVLQPIFEHFVKLEQQYVEKCVQLRVSYIKKIGYEFTYKNFKKMLGKFGLSKKEIRWELTKFILDPNDEVWNDWIGSSDDYWDIITKEKKYIQPEIYGYYSAYDHVCLAWIYGKMIDLPDSIPMYTRDLKQILDDKVEKHLEQWAFNKDRFSDGVSKLKQHPEYPKQDNVHDALDDARWNKNLYEFLKNLK